MQNTQDAPLSQLFAALAKAQGAFKPIEKNRAVEIRTKERGSYKFKYADLEAVISATRPALAANGLAVVQLIVNGEGGQVLDTQLVHEGGGYITSRAPIPRPDSYDLKNYGATLTYLRRYAYSALLCVAADDDLDEDGEGGTVPMGRSEAPPARSEAPPAGNQLPAYPQAKFEEHLQARREGVASGKTTPGKILMMLASRYTLSDEQVAIINALQEPQA